MQSNNASSVFDIYREGAVLWYPVPFDQDPLVQAGVVQPGLHQGQGVVLEVVENVHVPHAACLRPHPVRDSLVEVTEEPEDLLVQGTVPGHKGGGRGRPGEPRDVVCVGELVLVQQLAAHIVWELVTRRVFLDPVSININLHVCELHSHSYVFTDVSFT